MFAFKRFKLNHNNEKKSFGYTKKGIEYGTIPETTGKALLGKFSEESSEKSQSKRRSGSNATVIKHLLKLTNF